MSTSRMAHEQFDRLAGIHQSHSATRGPTSGVAPDNDRKVA